MDCPFVAARCAPPALTASHFVCYNAGHCQFNRNEPDFSFGTGRNGMASRRAAVGLVTIGLSVLVWSGLVAGPEMKKRLIELGGEPLIGSPEAFGAMIAAETENGRRRSNSRARG
jgi:hypothetical protein